MEIERKFLPSALPAHAAGAESIPIEQGYLALDGPTEVRLRRAGEALRLTVKSGRGEEREEVEIELTEGQFAALWPLAAERSLRKTRSLLPLDAGLSAEIDRFEGPLTGLLVAEVEFASGEESRAWQPPAWFGREVTGDDAYSNRNLAVDGAPKGLDRGAPNGETAPVSSPYRLEADESAPDGVRRIAAGRAAKAVKRLGEVEEDGGATAIHAARKDLKKLRAVLRLVRSELGEKRYRAQNEAYRDAGRLLSDTRDAEVKVETLDDLEERFAAEFPLAAVDSWRRDLERERYAAGTDAGGDLAERVEAARAKIDAARAEIPTWPLDRDSFQLVAPGLLKAYERGRESLAAVRKSPSADAVHDWRKRAKDLWYHLRILRELWPGPLGATSDQAHALADLLGDHHDLAVLAADLDRRDLLDPDAVRVLVERRQQELLDRAVALGELLYAEKPKAFGRRIGRYWEAARG